MWDESRRTEPRVTVTFEIEIKNLMSCPENSNSNLPKTIRHTVTLVDRSGFCLTTRTQIEFTTIRTVASPMARTFLDTATRLAGQVARVSQFLTRLSFVDRDMHAQPHVAVLALVLQQAFLVLTRRPRRKA